MITVKSEKLPNGNTLQVTTVDPEPANGHVGIRMETETRLIGSDSCGGAVDCLIVASRRTMWHDPVPDVVVGS